MLMDQVVVDSPLGKLRIEADALGITSITFDAEGTLGIPVANEHIEACVQQLREYFSGERVSFDLQLNPKGTSFQGAVWDLVYKIPYGKTDSYGAIAIQLGDAKLSRAVGLANGANPIPIVVPCHRVIGANGKLTGYAGGLQRKEWLLNHEWSKSGNKGQLIIQF